MGQAHRGKGIAGTHFDKYMKCLCDSFDEAGAKTEDVEDIFSRLKLIKSFVIDFEKPPTPEPKPIEEEEAA